MIIIPSLTGAPKGVTAKPKGQPG